MNESVEYVDSLLRKDDVKYSIRERFWYYKYWDWDGTTEQETYIEDGTVLHLAVMRNDAKTRRIVVQKLLDKNADITRWTRRKLKEDEDDMFVERYNVLHTALKEPLVAIGDLVQCLLDNDVPLVDTADAESPLHMAYRHGALAAIRKFRELVPQYAVEWEQRETSPLGVGFSTGRLSHRQLIEIAPPTASSVMTILKSAPHCLPRFLRRNLSHQEKKDFCSLVLQGQITQRDLATLITRSPTAGRKVFELLTSRPFCEHPVGHPLPTKVKFRSDPPSQMRIFNAQQFATFYVEDSTWRFNSKKYKCPQWHNYMISRRKWRKPGFLRSSSGARVASVDNLGTNDHTKDEVMVLVCHVKDLLASEVRSHYGTVDQRPAPWLLASLAATKDLRIFRSDTIQAVVSCVWWRGVFAADIVNCLLTLWGLCLITFTHLSSYQLLPIARDFIGCRAVIDLLLELLECVGFWRNEYGEFGLSYFTVRNFFELCSPMICVAFMLIDIADKDSYREQTYGWSRQTLLSLVIFQHWYRLSQMYRCFQGFAHGILPVSLSLEYTIPAVFLTSVIFTGLVQSLWVFVEKDRGGENFSFYSHVYQSFGLLLTQDYPESQGLAKGDFMMLLALAFFTLIVMNFFIGVISEAYEAEKKQVELRLWSERAKGCASYFARARFFAGGCGCPSRAKAVTARTESTLSSESEDEGWEGDHGRDRQSRQFQCAWTLIFQVVVLCLTIGYQVVLVSWIQEGSDPYDGSPHWLLPHWLLPKVSFLTAILILHVMNYRHQGVNVYRYADPTGVPWDRQGCYLWIVKKRKDIDESEDSDEEEAAAVRKIIREEIHGMTRSQRLNMSYDSLADSNGTLGSPLRGSRHVRAPQGQPPKMPTVPQEDPLASSVQSLA
jgi:hypothetical protein